MFAGGGEQVPYPGGPQPDGSRPWVPNTTWLRYKRLCQSSAPAADAATVIHGFRDYLRTAPDEVSAQTVSFTMPEDEHLPSEAHNPCTIVAAVCAGAPDEDMDVLEPRGSWNECTHTGE